jgi:hypothetical protein
MTPEAFDALAQHPAGELRLLSAAGHQAIAEAREEVEWLKVVLDAIKTTRGTAI